MWSTFKNIKTANKNLKLKKKRLNNLSLLHLSQPFIEVTFIKCLLYARLWRFSMKKTKGREGGRRELLPLRTYKRTEKHSFIW